ncbi:MAG TPA: hypothetical protein V6D09_11720 [Leptolyngbyaceae cyanobacterium]
MKRFERLFAQKAIAHTFEHFNLLTFQINHRSDRNLTFKQLRNREPVRQPTHVFEISLPTISQHLHLMKRLSYPTAIAPPAPLPTQSLTLEAGI